MQYQLIRISLIALSGAFTLIATLPYLRDILRGKTKPRIASWLIWTAIPAVGAAASFTQHQIPAAVFALVVTIQGLAIVILGYKHGDRHIELLDVICLIGATAGLIALVLAKSPVLALVLVLITDFLGLVPTVKHAWLRPQEETWSLFALEGIGCVITLLVSDFHVFTAIGYPLYLAICDVIVTAVILVRSRPTHSTGAIRSQAFVGSVGVALSPTTIPQFSPTPIAAPVAPSAAPPNIAYNVDSQPNAKGWSGKQTLGSPVWSSNPADRSSLVTLSLPVVGRTSVVEEGECFGPIDPGQGQGALMTLASGQLSFTFRASMSPGQYPLHVRAKDAAGNWGQVVTSVLVVK